LLELTFVLISYDKIE